MGQLLYNRKEGTQMRNPDLISNASANQNTLIDIPEDIEPFYPQEYDPFDEKSMKKYFVELKKMVRSSIEYQSLIEFLKLMGLDHCSIMPNLTNQGKSKVKIEIHHHPMDLETICRVIYKKRLQCGEPTDTRSTAYEVMWNHYSLLVGLIPLCETVHELVHSGVLFINANKVYGFYKHFIDRYYNYFDPEDLETLEKIATESAKAIEDYGTLLAQNYINVDMHTPNIHGIIKDTGELAHEILISAKTADQQLLQDNVLNEFKQPKVIQFYDMFRRKEN